MPRKLVTMETNLFGEVRVRPADGTFYADASQVKNLLIAIDALDRKFIVHDEPCPWCKCVGYHDDCPLPDVFHAAENVEMEEWCGSDVDLVKHLWDQELLGRNSAGRHETSRIDTLFELQKWCVDKREQLRTGQQRVGRCKGCKRIDTDDTGWRDDNGNLWCDECVFEKLKAKREKDRSLHARIALHLGWDKEDAQKLSLADLRELVQGELNALVQEISDVIRRGEHIVQEKQRGANEAKR